VCGRASESTIIGHIIPGSATGIVTTFDICRFQGVTALALTTMWKPWVFAIILVITVPDRDNARFGLNVGLLFLRRTIRIVALLHS
jgi:hypothetical protein